MSELNDRCSLLYERCGELCIKVYSFCEEICVKIMDVSWSDFVKVDRINDWGLIDFKICN